MIRAIILVALVVSGCVSNSRMERILWEKDDQVVACAMDQWKDYGDLCAESSSGYEQMDGTDAHYQGTMCGAMGVMYCLELSWPGD